MTPLERAQHVRSQLPAEGLFAEKAWRTAPGAFALSPTHVELIEKLGIVLHHFNTRFGTRWHRVDVVVK